MKKTKLLSIVGLMSCSLLLFACGKNDNKPANTSKENTKVEEKSEEKPEAEAVSLADWEGEWNNMGGYLDREEVQGAFKTLAEKEKTDEATAKAAYLEKRACEFDGLKIEGDKITFLSTFPSEGGDVKGEGTYKFVEAKEVPHGNMTLSWNVFEAEGDGAPYKYLLMMPIHGEEALTHFHMRYGNDKDELLAKEGWFPTFVKPTSTNDQIIDEITE